MPEFALEIFAGLATGVISLIIGLFWKTGIKPLLENMWYDGIHISGRWKVVVKEEDPSVADVCIDQWARRITGTVTWVQDGTTYIYDLSGEFRDNLLTASFKTRNKQEIDRGTITLQAVGGGKILSGCFAWYDPKETKIISGEYELHRTGNA